MRCKVVETLIVNVYFVFVHVNRKYVMFTWGIKTVSISWWLNVKTYFYSKQIIDKKYIPAYVCGSINRNVTVIIIKNNKLLYVCEK